MPSRLRRNLRKLKYSRNYIGKFAFLCISYPWLAMKFLFNSRFRSEQVSRIKYTSQILQVSTYTIKDRYPVLFKAISKELKSIENPKILSFGCSTGEEVFSLKELLPSAEIIGVDINMWCIKNAIKRNVYKDCRFYHSLDVDWQMVDHYDCILALAIFQKTIHRNPNINQSNLTFQFQKFSDSINDLDKLLNLQGLLAIDHSDYLFEDSILAKNYTVLKDASSIIRQRPTFNRINKKTNRVFISSRIFRKQFQQ